MAKSPWGMGVALTAGQVEDLLAERRRLMDEIRSAQRRLAEIIGELGPGCGWSFVGQELARLQHRLYLEPDADGFVRVRFRGPGEYPDWVHDPEQKPDLILTLLGHHYDPRDSEAELMFRHLDPALARLEI